MYQGKFDKKRKNTSLDIQEVKTSRSTPSRSTGAPVATPPAQREPDVLSRRHVAQQQAAARQQAMERQQAAARQAAAQRAPEPVEEKRRGPRLGSVIFYTFYFLFIFVFFAATYVGLQWLHGWLTDYEAAQPTVKCQEVFEDIFSDPDWGALYDAAGIEDTIYEGKEAYVTYMENKVGDQPLTYQETSAGLSKGKKYFVRLGDERVATFTLVAKGDTDSVTAFPDWQLGSVELVTERAGSCRIQTLDSHTVAVNGVKLGEEHIIQTASTRAEEFLPEGTTGSVTCIREVTGLMIAPTVTVTDEKGEAVEVVYSEETGMYVAQSTGTAAEIGAAEKELCLEAVKSFGRFMIEAGGLDTVGKYFDTSAKAYKDIASFVSNRWMQNYSNYKFMNDSVTEYVRYTDKLFSARVATDLNVTRGDGSVKTYEVNTTLFFKHNGTSWKCYYMTNEDVQEPVGTVRLTFMNNGEELSSKFYPTYSETLETPLVSAPEGKVFAGWVQQVTDSNGNASLRLVFAPDENGVVSIPKGTTLEPMTLFAYFETEAEAAASAAAAAAQATEATEATEAAATTEGE